MERIIEPVARELLEAELSPERLLRTTRRGGNGIYTFTAAECPWLMREVGRLREEAFRAAGGGTGRSVDIDDDDRAADGYRQLVVWDPDAREIVGGYRYIICRGERPQHLSTEHYFRFSERFRRNFLPRTIELGRSFVQPRFQSRNDPRGLYALDNLWDGLGAVVRLNPQARYLFGKVTFYAGCKRATRELLSYFLRRFFPDREHLVTARRPLPAAGDDRDFERLFSGATYQENYRILVSAVRRQDSRIPPMINSYMRLSPTMRVFDTVANPDFGDVEETGIMLTIPDIYPELRARYITAE